MGMAVKTEQPSAHPAPPHVLGRSGAPTAIVVMQGLGRSQP